MAPRPPSVMSPIDEPTATTPLGTAAGVTLPAPAERVPDPEAPRLERIGRYQVIDASRPLEEVQTELDKLVRGLLRTRPASQ